MRDLGKDVAIYYYGSQAGPVNKRIGPSPTPHIKIPASLFSSSVGKGGISGLAFQLRISP
jgi:hypothetical protein